MQGQKASHKGPKDDNGENSYLQYLIPLIESTLWTG